MNQRAALLWYHDHVMGVTKFDVYATNQKDAMIYAATSDGHIAAIRPILREGEVGKVVMDWRAEPIASAR